MSKLEELIQQYCPDGVEWKPLGEVCDIHKGVQFNKTDMKEVGTYPVINGGINPSGYAEVFNEGKNTITISQGGASAGYVNFLRNKFWLGAHCYAVIPYDTVLNKYLYHFIKMNEITLQQCQYGAGIPALAKSTISSLEIPVPPLPVQEEIVRILDTFTELQAELQAELQKRKQQYNYYRDNLLTNFTPEQAPKEYTLGEVTVDIYSGATPSKEKREYWGNGTIPWMSSGEVNLGQVYEVEGRITQLGYDKCSTKMVPEGSVVIALAGQGKTRGTVAILRTSVCTNQSLAALVPQKEIVSGEYLYYYLKTQYAKLREVSAGDGTRGGLNLKMLRAYKVVIPSHKAQGQIVSILDRFDTLTTDLTQGLPAEIEKRRQQYEYYRDKLLTFKRKGA